MIRKASPYVLSLLLLLLAFPPFSLWPLAFFALVPLLLQPRLKAFPLLFWGGFLHCGLLYWIVGVLIRHGGMPWSLSVLAGLLLYLYLSLFLLPPLLLWNPRRPWLLPFLFLFFELLQEYLLTGFPWAILADSQASNPFVRGLWPLVGVRGVSFLIVAVNVGLALAVQKRRLRPAAVPLGLFFLCSLLVFLPLPRQGKRVRVGAVQGNAAMEKDWTGEDLIREFSFYRDETRRLFREGADLVVWPEFSFPFYPRYQYSLTEAVQSLVPEGGRVLVAGGNDRWEGRDYNTAFVFHRDRWEGYYKVHLTPFGEYIPFRFLFPFAKRIAHVEGEFTPGKVVRLFSAGGFSFATPICYEVVFPSLVSRFSRQGPGMIVTITNDGWFGATSGPYQHLGIARIRAMEASLPLIRAATTGVSVLYSARGKEIARVGYNQRGTLRGEVVLSGGPSLYHRYFSLWEGFWALAGILSLLLSLRASRRSDKG